MRLTAYSNYSLRTLMVAAMRSPVLSTVQEVADAFGISRAHLVKCVHRLGRWGYLENVRGNRGGFRLARRAEEISLGEVVRRTEEGFDLVECFDPATATCPLVGRCRLSLALRRARDVFLAELDRLTIADVAANRDAILDLLHLDETDQPRACGGIAIAAAKVSGSMSSEMSSTVQPESSALKME